MVSTFHVPTPYGDFKNGGEPLTSCVTITHLHIRISAWRGVSLYLKGERSWTCSPFENMRINKCCKAIPSSHLHEDREANAPPPSLMCVPKFDALCTTKHERPLPVPGEAGAVICDHANANASHRGPTLPTSWSRLNTRYERKLAAQAHWHVSHFYRRVVPLAYPVDQVTATTR